MSFISLNIINLKFLFIKFSSGPINLTKAFLSKGRSTQFAITLAAFGSFLNNVIPKLISFSYI